jgi:ribonuclease E
MLINGQHAEELRVAVVEDEVLESFQIEVAESGQERGNIYRGVVANVEPSLDAAFIDYGNEKHGFLTSHDVVRQAYHRQPASDRRPGIGDIVEKGRSILVQVARDAMGTKGAALTTSISLPGRYLVLTPFDSGTGLSRKIEDETVRKQLKEKVKSLAIPEGHGFIVRTSALDQTKTALKADLTASLRLWKRVQAEFKRGKRPKLLYDDQDLIVQALRDYLDAGIEEVLIDDEQLLERASEYVKATMPRSKVQLSRYSGRVPLFSRYNLEPQIDSIYRRSVALEGGGSIVVDPTEALTAIDVNSGKNTRGSTQEETAYKTNLEAAREVARQLRLRNIGGLVVVDFIDMRSSRHRGAVEKTLRDAMKRDKSRVGVGRISSNGLLEINRQRVKQALVQRMHRTCPTCDGVGLLATPELVGLRLLRRIEARAATGRLRKVHIGLHPELADAIQNQRRKQLVTLEAEYGIQIEIVAAPHLHRSEEETDWVVREAAVDPAEARPERRAERGGRPPSQAANKGRDARSGGDQAPTESEEAPAESDQATGERTPGPNAAEATEGSDSSKESNGQRSRRRRRRPRRRRRRGPLAETLSEVAQTARGLSQVPTDLTEIQPPEAGGIPVDRRADEPSGAGKAPAATALQTTPTDVDLMLSQPSDAATAEPTARGDTMTPAEPSSGAELAPTSEKPPSKSRRSRRRGGARRRSSKASRADSSPSAEEQSPADSAAPSADSAGESEAAASPSDSSGDEQPARPKAARRRPSRRRSSSRKQAPSEDSPTSGEASTSAMAASGEVESAGSTDASEGPQGETAKSSRPRRRTPRRKAKAPQTGDDA